MLESSDYEINVERTVTNGYKIEPGEYKFYEDENYEYYYPTQKTKVVKVYFKNGDFITAEQALKEGRITIDLLDKYEVKYIKKQKQQ